MTDPVTTTNLLARHFVARNDVKAVQHGNGAWTPDRTKFTRADLVAHVEGKQTLGHYLLGEDSTCKLFCYDIDVDKVGEYVDGLGDRQPMNPREAILDPGHPAHRWLIHQVRCMAEGLSITVERKLGIKTAILWTGGKGAHVYGLTGRVPAAEARGAARWILDDYGVFEAVRGEVFFKHTFRDDPEHGYPHLTLEVFPKQDNLDGKDLGNLLRLPLGVNRRTRKESFFMDPSAPGGQLVALQPEEALTGMLWEGRDVWK
jgi:hypothetical protein